MVHHFPYYGDCLDEPRSDIDTDASNATSDREPATPPAGPPKELPPNLFHKVKNQTSVLALAVSTSCIYAGTQGGQILVWSSETYALLASIAAHHASVLCLCLSADARFLFSSAGDAIVNVWCTSRLVRLYSIYSRYDVGDVFCVAYCESLQTIFLGAQNTSIQVGDPSSFPYANVIYVLQWYDLSRKDGRSPPDPALHPLLRNHRFFDSKGPGGISTPRPFYSAEAHSGQDLEIGKEDIIQYAHHGYVYCMLLSTNLSDTPSGAEVLISGGGDGSVKVWSLDYTGRRGISLLSGLENGDEPVLSMAISGTILYSGRSEGSIDVWDLDARQLVRSIQVQTADVLAITVAHGYIFSGSADGYSRKFNSRYECLSKWKSHAQLVLASATASSSGRAVYITGGNDDCFTTWDISDCVEKPARAIDGSNEKLLAALAAFVSFRTVSALPRYAEQCRRGASWLRKTLNGYGAETHLLSTDGGHNPVVLARFHGDRPKGTKKKTILFYAHYDVVAAENDQNTWNSDPFEMHGINGYLYGRGISDNKGPLLAALFAVIDLVGDNGLDCDVVFLIEGEEECGSRGFQAAVQNHRHLIGDVDWILLANSYWLDDEFPCLTYGLRGVLQATVTVESPRPDLHSGVDGSHLVHEAVKDLLAILAPLNGPNGDVNIRGFYDPIPSVSSDEEKRYAAISKLLLLRDPTLGDTKSLTRSLKARWREPSLTIHRIDTSGPANSTIIPCVAKATISIRLVPNQSVRDVQKALVAHLKKGFSALDTSNELSITVQHQADPWLGDPTNALFQTLERAVMAAWGPISPNRRGSISTKSPHTQSPKKPYFTRIKPQPATSSTLTNGSDVSSQATSPIQRETNYKESPVEMRDREAVFELRSPLYIREGGSIPAIRFLEQELDAPAAHLPCGQASDSAHLDNERMRLANLYKSREIFRTVFREMPST